MDQKKIGKFITEGRKNKNLTQRELAEQLGVTNRTIINWENGKCLPDYSLLIPLCEILDITIDGLLGTEDSKKQKDTTELILDYLDRNRQINLKQKQFIGRILLLGGTILVLFVLFFFPPYYMLNYDTNTFIYIGIVLAVLGFSLINNKYKFKKRILLNFLLVIVFMIFLTVQDTLNVIINNHPPRFYTSSISEKDALVYSTLFYDVYWCFNQDDKYHFVSKKDAIDYTKSEIISPSYYYCNEE